MRLETARRGYFCVHREGINLERFSRTKILIGQEGLDALARTRVVIFGVGGVGSFTAEALARAGVGYLRLVDHDCVDASNINRQLHALSSTVGLAKVQVLARRFREINPNLVVEPSSLYSRSARNCFPAALTGWWIPWTPLLPGGHNQRSLGLGLPSSQHGRRQHWTPACSGWTISPRHVSRVIRRELGRLESHQVPVVWSPEHGARN